MEAMGGSITARVRRSGHKLPPHLQSNRDLHLIHRPCFIDNPYTYTPLVYRHQTRANKTSILVQQGYQSKRHGTYGVLALAAAASSSSAQQIGWEWPQQGTYGAAAAVHPCDEFLRQPQCSPVAAPYYVRRGQ